MFLLRYFCNVQYSQATGILLLHLRRYLGCVVIKFVIFVVSFHCQFPAFFCGNVRLPRDVIKKIIAILDILFAASSLFISWKLNSSRGRGQLATSCYLESSTSQDKEATTSHKQLSRTQT